MISLTEEDYKMLKEKGIKIPEDSIIINWEDKRKEIHPALDFNCSVAYVSQTLPITTSDKKNEDTLCMIGSDKKVIVLNREQELINNEIKLKYIPNVIDNRWSLKSIKSFLEEDTKISMKEVFEEVREHLKYYMDFPDKRMYDLMALWCMGTYFHPMFNSFPYIYVNAVKRSGKSKLLTLMQALAFNAKMSLSVTPSTMFRLIQGNRCTLLMDETENLRNKELFDYRSILLGGYKKGCKVPRAHETSKKGGYEVGEYSVYAPKMLANIDGIEDVLEDRCITLILLRAKDYNVGNREINLEDERWVATRDKLYINLMLNWPQIKEKYSLLSDYFSSVVSVDSVGSVVNVINVYNNDNNDIHSNNHLSYTLHTETTLNTLKERLKNIKQRDLELWMPIFSMALAIDDALFDSIINYCIISIAEKNSENSESNDNMLVEVLYNKFKTEGYYSVKDILIEFMRYIGVEDAKESKWITPRWLGRTMRRLGFKEKRRLGSGFEYFIRPSFIKELADRNSINLEHFTKQKTLGDVVNE